MGEKLKAKTHFPQESPEKKNFEQDGEYLLGVVFRD